MKFSLKHVLPKNKALKKLIKNRKVLALAILGVLVLSSVGGYVAFAAFGSTANKTEPITKSPAKVTEKPKADPKPQPAAEAAPPSTAAPAPAAQPAPATKPAPVVQKAPAPKPQPDPKADCQQRIAALRVPYDAKVRASVAEQQAVLAAMKQSYDSGGYSGEFNPWEAYSNDVSEINAAYLEHNNAEFAAFTEQIKAIGCWF